jgi:hypothetical protein
MWIQQAARTWTPSMRLGLRGVFKGDLKHTLNQIILEVPCALCKGNLRWPATEFVPPFLPAVRVVIYVTYGSL